MSLAVRGNRILTPQPCAADISSLIGLDNNTSVSCIDASGALRILPVNAATPSQASDGAVALTNAVSQVEARPGELWVGRSDGKGIIIYSEISKAVANLPVASPPSANNSSSGDIVSHLCLVRTGAVVASVHTQQKNQGFVSLWNVETRSLISSAPLPSSIQMPVLAVCCHNTTRRQQHQQQQQQLWISDMRGLIVALDATTLNVVHDDVRTRGVSNASEVGPFTCLLSVPERDEVWAGSEGGSIIVFSGSSGERVKTTKLTGGRAQQQQSSVPVTAMCRAASAAGSDVGDDSAAAAGVWIACLDGSVTLFEVDSLKSVFALGGSSTAGADEAAASMPYACALLSIQHKQTQLLISGGTSKIVTLQTVVVLDAQSQSPARPATVGSSSIRSPQPQAPPGAAAGTTTTKADHARSSLRRAPSASSSFNNNNNMGSNNYEQQQRNNNEQLVKSEAKVNALLKRVAELELDLMQAQAIGAELTKRILTVKEASPSPPQHQRSRYSQQQQHHSPAAVSSVAVPKVTIGIQVDALHSGNNGNDGAATTAMIIKNRVDELEDENDKLRRQVEMLKARNNEQSRELQHFHETATRPMDDYELRCMQRLILENEKLRSDLAAARRKGFTVITDGEDSQQQQQQQQQQSAAMTSEKGSNILTVCFLTLRSVLGHHLASQIVLAAIGDEQEEEDEEQEQQDEVETIEKLVYELAIRVQSPRAPEPEK